MPAPLQIAAFGEFTIRELAKLGIEMTESRSELTFLPLPENDPKTRRPDITIAGDMLDWEPRVELRKGLEKTIPYFRRLVDEQGAVARTL